MGFALIAFIIIIFFLWAVNSLAKKPSPEPLTEEQLAQRRYNAEQFLARSKQITASASRPPAKTPKKPSPTPTNNWPFPSPVSTDKK